MYIHDFYCIIQRIKCVYIYFKDYKQVCDISKEGNCILASIFTGIAIKLYLFILFQG